MSKYEGLTIHSGWYPQLLKGNPAKKFSSKANNKGISVKGYNKTFVNQISTLEKERGKDFLSGTIPTVFAGVVMMDGLDEEDSFAMALGMGVVGAMTRPKKYSDFVSAKQYEDSTKAMSIRGNHIWYMLGKTGPKDMAKALLDKPNFSFDNAEKWYKDALPSLEQQVTWAQDTLGLGKNIDKTINIDDIEKIGDVAEELIFKKHSSEINKQLAMKVPKKTGTASKPRDIDSSNPKFGEIESTELLSKKAHHGLPEDALRKAVDEKSGKLTESSWKKFMKDTVIKDWNQYTAKVLARNKGNKKETIKKITKTPSALMTQFTTEENIATARKIRHEFSIANIKQHGKEFGTSWREGIPITARNPVTGNRTYASSELELKQTPKKILFELGNVRFIRGLNHTLALVAAENGQESSDAAGFYVDQQNHLAHARMNMEEGATTVNGITSQGFDKLTQGVNHTTNVTFSPKVGKLWLDEVAKMIGKKVTEEGKARSQQIQKKLKDKAMSYHDIFWALPYISIEEGLWKG